MKNEQQLSFGDGLLSYRRKISNLAKHLTKLDAIVDCQPLIQEISVIDKTNGETGGRPHKNSLWMIKVTFFQSLLSLNDPQLEDQLIDRLSFQRFVGIHSDQEMPDFTTFWRFKEALAIQHLDERIFELIQQQLDAKRLIIKKGTIVDAAILSFSTRPLSDKKRQELVENPSFQINTDGTSTCKRGTYHFGYKDHIGVDIESKLIRKASFTPAHKHDSTQTEKLVSYDEKALFGDKAYGDGHHKYSAHHYDWFYGVLDKAKRGQALSKAQKKRNPKLSRVRSAVEHPFAWMKTRANLTCMGAKNQIRNRLRLVFACIGWTINRAGFLLASSRTVGLLA